MYITINNIKGEKRIDLSYSIQNFDSSKEITVIRMLSDNVQYQILKLCSVMDPISDMKKLIPSGTYASRELLSMLEGIIELNQFEVDDQVTKMNKLKGITEITLNVFVAHNGSAYDSQFIYKHAHEYFGSRNVQVLMHNNRMIELMLQVNMGFRLATVYFKDSYKFINLPLHLLPKSFGFHNELQKGFFPHDLNMKENLQYVSDSLPDAIYFGINDMTSDERIRFLSWYDSEKLKYETNDSLSYNLHEEMIKYCYDDCFVLAAAFTKFNESMILELKSTGVEGIIDHDYTY